MDRHNGLRDTVARGNKMMANVQYYDRCGAEYNAIQRQAAQAI
jgi:hypothetical protein